MLYLDSANIDDLKRAKELGIVEGTTTNPTILKKENVAQEDIIHDVLSLTTGHVYVQTEGTSTEEILSDAQRLLNLFPDERIALKIPAHLAGIAAIKRMKEKRADVNILATAIYSSDQGLLAALAGSDMIAPYINRMANNNIDPYKVIAETATLYEEKQLKTRILGASFKNTDQVIRTLVSGAHAVTVPFEIIEQMANKGLALAAIDVFNEDARLLRESSGEK